MYNFKDDYKTGIESIDDEHRKLFEIADRAYEIMIDDFIPDKYDYIVEILKELKDYATTHFKNEEDYMVSIGYKKLFTQKMEHMQFMEKMEQYDLEAVDENQKEVIMELLDFLGNWLVDHILESDKLIGK